MVIDSTSLHVSDASYPTRVLLARRCPVCARLGPAPCAACIAELEPPPRRPPPRGLDRLATAFAYAGGGRELVARLKYRNARAAVPWLADAMAVAVGAGAPARVEVVTWVPTTTRRRRRRGYDQAEVLARALARRLRLPCRPLLRRLPGPAQTGRSRTERRLGPTLVGPRRPTPVTVLVVDDVVTSGATLSAAALALRAAGARRVEAVTVASTPLKLPPTVVEALGDGTGKQRSPRA